MSFKDTLKKALTPELFTQVTDTLGDDFDYDMVPRSRLNKVIGQRNDYKRQLEEGLDPKPDDDEGSDDDQRQQPGANKGGKSFTQAEVDALLKAEKDKYDTELENLNKQTATISLLKAAGAINPEMLIKAGMVDPSKLTKDKDGKYTGLDDDIKSVKEDNAYLFGEGDDNHQRGTGKDSGEGSGGSKSKLDTALDQIFGPYRAGNE